MKLKRDTKYGEELTRCFKISVRNLTNLNLSTQKIFTLMGSFWANYVFFELKRYRGIIFHEIEEGYKVWRGIELSFQNWHKEFDKIWPEHSKISKIFILMSSFWRKVYIVWAKKVQSNNLSWNLKGIQNMERNWLVVSKLV